MSPIYDSDIAEERWSKAEWNHYELWEKVEQRLRKHNRLWILATALIVLFLSSIPIIIDQRPKWKTLSAVRKLGQEINRIKREAAFSHLAYRIRFEGGGSLSYVVETAARCEETQFQLVRPGSLLESDVNSFVLLSREQGNQMNVPGLVDSFCYDPLMGSESAHSGESVVGFAIIPTVDFVNNLTAARMDRLSVILLSGPSVDLSFE